VLDKKTIESSKTEAFALLMRKKRPVLPERKRETKAKEKDKDKGVKKEEGDKSKRQKVI
jgi:hypothetical protein